MSSFSEATSSIIQTIDVIHTLGPAGTNCEAAARHWLETQRRRGEIRLHRTLEDAAQHLEGKSNAALLSCVVYPELHTLVFRNLDRFALVDVFLMPTMDMVLASRGQDAIHSVASHPAPFSLIPEEVADRRLATSNTAAAHACATGEVDACITTSAGAALHRLRVVQRFGEVPMGFAIHAPLPGWSGADRRERWHVPQG